MPRSVASRDTSRIVEILCHFKGPLIVGYFEIAQDLTTNGDLSKPPTWASTMFRATSKFVIRSPQWRRLYTQSRSGRADFK